MHIYNLDNYNVIDLMVNDSILQEIRVKAYINKVHYPHYRSTLSIMHRSEFILFERKSKKYEFFIGIANDEMTSWCLENTPTFSIEHVKCYKHRFGGNSFIINTFKKAEDAVAFKLKWL